jgi:hypothetical protein
MTKPEVQCVHCAAQVPHVGHWFPGCTCAAGGCGTRHRDHCNLHSPPGMYTDEPWVTLVYDDSYLEDKRGRQLG